MPECKYRLCHVIFESSGRGKKKKYCCTQHRDKERYRLKMDQQFLARKGVSHEEHQMAREYAALNCLHYTKCLFGLRMSCFGCDYTEFQKDAWKHEPGVLICNETDFTDHIA